MLPAFSSQLVFSYTRSLGGSRLRFLRIGYVAHLSQPPGCLYFTDYIQGSYGGYIRRYVGFHLRHLRFIEPDWISGSDVRAAEGSSATSPRRWEC